MNNNITNTELLHPEDIARALSCFISEDYYTWKERENNLLEGLYTLYTICQNPFNSDEYRALYDSLSAVAEKLTANDYYQ